MLGTMAANVQFIRFLFSPFISVCLESNWISNCSLFFFCAKTITQQTYASSAVAMLSNNNKQQKESSLNMNLQNKRQIKYIIIECFARVKVIPL